MTFSVKQPYGRWYSLCNLFHDVTFLKASYLPLTQKTLESVLALNYYVYYFNTNIICYTVCTSSFSGIMMAWAFTVSLYICYWWFITRTAYAPLNWVSIHRGTKLLQVSSSLNSSYCYILQTETFIFTWIGSLSSTRDHDLLDRMLELINVCNGIFCSWTWYWNLYLN